MAFYDLPKPQRQQLVAELHQKLLKNLQTGKTNHILKVFSDEDTYIRKTGYLTIGRIYKSNPELKKHILALLDSLFLSENELIRQTVINAAGEIGMIDFEPIAHLMEKGLFDAHHRVRNAVIGSIKKMSEKNPEPTLTFARQFLHHPDKEIRREICHGIELRGRTHPQDILPMLQELQFDSTARVRNTLVHVLGQIAYKKGCLETVVAHLKNWENQELVKEALEEIIDVHYRYSNFSFYTQKQAKAYIAKHF
ncbi:MAG: HEAT repeat domain-containing protein [Bacteroidia bacterium]